MNLWVPISFFVTALLYAMVGFGGGSTYAAVLALARIDHTIAPVIVLICNIVVVSGGVFHYYRANLLDVSKVMPLVLCSVPLAWLGGTLQLSRQTYLFVLGAALLLSGLLLLLEKPKAKQPSLIEWPPQWRIIAPVFGGGLGFLAGLVGIGGGIFLAPIMHHLKITTAKRIAATASLFILVNSLAGLIGQIMKLGLGALHTDQFGSLLWLPLIVFLAGQVGSRVSVKILDGDWIKRLTGLLVTLVGIRLLWTNGPLI